MDTQLIIDLAIATICYIGGLWIVSLPAKKERKR